MHRLALFLVLLPLINGCAPTAINSCPSPVLPDEFVMEYMDQAPTGVQRWYGAIITQQCLLAGEEPDTCN